MRVVAIAQARMGSTRFPGKVMKDLAGKPVLRWVVDALRSAPGVDHVVIATSTLEADDVIEGYCHQHSIDCYRGSESNVLDRFFHTAVAHGADLVLRITCDCPFIDPHVVGQVVQLLKSAGCAYASNQPTWPDGLDVECFTFAALEAAYVEAKRPSDLDCVTQFIIRNQHRFPAEYLVCPFPGAYKERWVLDTEKDYAFCQEIARRITKSPPSCMDILDILHREPKLREINAGAIRNERFYEGLTAEELPKREFSRSNQLLERANRVIPFGSQTFSKSHLFYPAPAAPLYITHGDGARVFDVDGHDYVDLVNALLPVVLGYRDPDVDDAVRRQLNRAGMSFSLATELEIQLAEKLCELIPCAEMVKFGKSGTDVTTAAVRLARAYTGRDYIIAGSYHGWADWSVCRGPHRAGIPKEVSELTIIAPKNLETTEAYWESWANKVAAVIVEPTHDRNYLQWLREYCSKHGIILIFDEIQTGFRYNLGGAQKHYGITPDLACFGKSVANGMPISALVGKREIMSLFDKGYVFYSGTFFGDTLSIAAALATIEKMEAEYVVDHLWETGADIISKIGIPPSPINFAGLPCLTKISFKDHLNAKAEQLQSLFTQEMAQQGVLVLNAHCLSSSIKKPEIERIVKAYKHTFAIMNECLEKQGEINKYLKGMIKGSGLRS